MVYDPLGYSGYLNAFGIVLEIIGFIMLLIQFQGRLKKFAQKVGDSKEEIRELNSMMIKYGIIFVIVGLVSQLVSVLLDAYFPGLYDDLPM